MESQVIIFLMSNCISQDSPKKQNQDAYLDVDIYLSIYPDGYTVTHTYPGSVWCVCALVCVCMREREIN